MGERQDGSNHDSQPLNPERTVRPLDMLKVLASSTTNSMTAATLLYDPLQKGIGGEYGTRDLRNAMQPLFQGEDVASLPKPERFLDYARSLERFGIVSVVDTDEKEYGQPVYKIKLHEGLDIDLAKAVIGNVFQLVSENPGFSLEKVFSNVREEEGVIDSFTARSIIIGNIAHTYQQAYTAGEEYITSIAEISKQTNLPSTTVEGHIRSITSDLGLMTSLSAGYRLHAGVTRNTIQSVTAQRAYEALRRAQIDIHQESSFYPVSKLEALVDNPNNLQLGLRQLVDVGLADTVQRGTYTIAEDQAPPLLQINEIVQGCLQRSNAFIAKGLESFATLMKSPDTLAGIWTEGRESARGRKSSEASRREVEAILIHIVEEHPGITVALLRQVAKILPRDAIGVRKLTRYSRPSLSRMIKGLIERKMLHADYFGNTRILYGVNFMPETPQQVVASVLQDGVQPEQPIVVPQQEEGPEEVSVISDEELDRAFAGMDLSDPYAMFMLEIKTNPLYKMLPEEEQRRKFELLQTQKEQGAIDETLVEELINRNLRLVISSAKKYESGAQARFLDMMDLIQEGYPALRRAVLGFDATYGFAFSTYATRAIRSALTYALHQADVVPLPSGIINKVVRIARAGITYDEPDAVIKVQNALRRKDGTTVSEEVAQELLSIYEERPNIVSMHQQVFADRTLEDVIQAPSAQSGQMMREYLVERIRDTLTSKEANVILLRFGLLGEPKELTLDEVGKKWEELYGKAITRERVRQIESVALKKLRDNKELLELFNML